MGNRSFRVPPAGSGDAVVALRLEPSGAVDTAPAAERQAPSPAPSQFAPISGWHPPPSLDEYRLVELVGRGAMGEVYLAHDEFLDRPVAIKLISGMDPDPAAKDRFMLEARAAARLQHPNVLTVYRVGELDGRPYLITEFLKGKGLDELSKPVESKSVVRIGVGLARGLAAAHRRGVLHRDIKPGNAILTNDGEIKLLDFGLAKLLDVGESPATWRSPSVSEPPPPPPVSRSGGTLVSVGTEEPVTPVVSPRPGFTEGGALMGTPDYMAPEIWHGEPATRRTDIYALGALLFELCAGHPPHHDVPARLLSQTVQKREAPLLTSLVPSTDPKLAAVIERCLQRDPTRRFGSGDELREALEQIELTSRMGVIPEGNPYRGLHPFEAEHRGLFFGRRAEVGTLLDRIRNEAIVIVTGDSGVGKSSLCRAGVLPAIQEGGLGVGRAWTIIRFVPGRSPLLALSAALASLVGMDESTFVRRLRAHPGTLARALRKHLGDVGGVVVFVDQLEEMVTMAEPSSASVVAEALGHLAVGLPGVRLLATLRSDFLAPVAALPGLGEEMARALQFLKPLSQEGIREAITGPARVTGIRFESEALVETLVSSTSTAEGGLPLLQFALAELWEARDQSDGAITAQALEKIGGVTGALARHADEVILSMNADQRAAARRILFMLVSQQGTPVRRRRDELVADDARAREALDGLVRGRLLAVRDSTYGPTFELAHGALLRGWDTLRRWLDEHADSRAVRQRLAAAALEWERLGRSREALWSFRQLAELSQVDRDDLTPREAAFAAASKAALHRGRRRRLLQLAAIPFTVTVAWVGMELRATRELEHKVAVHVADAERLAEDARTGDEASLMARREAFAQFDALHREEGEATWERARALAENADLGYGRASQALETALTLASGRQDVVAHLGDVLYARALLAEREHHLEQRDELLQRLSLYDPEGVRRRRWDAPAELSIRTIPAGAQIAIDRYERDERRMLHDKPMNGLGTTPVTEVALEPGSYRLTFTLPGCAVTRYPILLERSERLALSIPLVEEERVPEGFVYIPPGRFLFGSAADEEARRSFFNTAPIHETSTGAYLIAREETTWAEWLEFLAALPPAERELRTPHVTGLTGAIELKDLGAAGFELTLQPTKRAYVARVGELIRYERRARRAVQDWLLFPVSGVSLEDARAYTGWLSSSGRIPGARLCTEREWERAARGADDREFPAGYTIGPDDANIDETYGKDPLAFGPDEVGSHPASRSPFGIDDSCGNVFEWTTSSLASEEHTLRGGAYYYDRTTDRSTNRQVAEPTIRDPNVGVRVCASID